MLSLKKKWHNGIVVPAVEREHYVREDDAVLIGTGMMREGPESQEVRTIIKKLFTAFPDKKWIIDAGALQIMDKNWLREVKTKPILTPNQREFQTLLGNNLLPLGQDEKIDIIMRTAREYQIVLLVKCGYDIVSDGEKAIVIEGGNAGLTKGGTGDILASMASCFYTRLGGVKSAVLGSYILKKTADELYKEKKFWFNNDDIISGIPKTLAGLLD